MRISTKIVYTITSILLLYATVGSLYAGENYRRLRRATAQTTDLPCQSFVRQPYAISQAVIIGDSLINFSPMENKISSELAAIGVSVSSAGFTYTISGWGIENALSVLNNGLLDADIAASEALILNLGVNNWNEAYNDLDQVQGWVDQFISIVKGINPNIIIVWIEPHAVAKLASNANVAAYTFLIADYLNSKDGAGEICLVDWSIYADNNPDTYAVLIGSRGQSLPVDGIHIYGHREEYVGLLIDVLQAVISENPPIPEGQ